MENSLAMSLNLVDQVNLKTSRPDSLLSSNFQLNYVRVDPK